jgi:hypothetical protein
MTAPSVDPFEIRIRDGLATKLGSVMSVANGYYYDSGSVNEYEVSNVTAWPRVLIRLDEETNLDDDGSRPVNSHYTNKLTFNITYEHEVTSDPDRVLIASKLLHDLKKFFGDAYVLSEYGAYMVRPMEYKFLHSSNKNLPTAVDMKIECEYYQLRTTPTGA